MEKAAAAGRSKGPGSLLRLLGPGLVTGAADDDPSGIATYSQAGAAGELTFALFAAGIIGTGLLAVPGYAAYAVAEAFGLRGSLELPASRALGFYGIVGAATLGGAVLAATRIDPIAMLFSSAVINGIVAVPIIVAVMLVISGRRGRMMFPVPCWL